ncbi:putative RNA 2'-phosphotransferase [Chitinophaga jiangningensis]|uniref:Probable RNA 2'-phosphotransferase n=1 Tax=Chitinophaga jiangningensis TaxID=1419482 RepID=A0A1M7AL91_9BACT|nr:RNA 2'-phosphotransferase [Chitinophaga jiangningensis]SHL43524.1 putative RNA 2'-phosphotransferase [Chitinophaga jiangningensis]
MDEKQKKHISKFLSLVLRHKPEEIGLELDANGWAVIDDLIAKADVKFSKGDLMDIVASSDKQRFALNEDQTKIRANQGHSINIDLGLPPSVPPEILYHGTAADTVGVIRKEGIQRMSRQYVHLSTHKDTAVQVGGRHGAPVIVTVRTGEMHADGLVFYLSENKVWLTEFVPAKYID